MAKFYNQDMAELAHQLTLSPRRIRLAQLQGIEHLLSLVEPKRVYPSEFVCYHITKYRKRGSVASFSIPGKALICDLVAMAELISLRAQLSVSELTEPYETHLELAQRLQVSTKTIRRWRPRGLMGIRVVFTDGVNRLAFLRGTVQRFVGQNQALVSKAAAFTQLSSEERVQVARRAGEILAKRPMKLHAVAREIAEETGRAVETIRYTLRRIESTPEGRKLLGTQGGVARHNERFAAIARCHASGEAIEAIAEAFDTSPEDVAQVLRSVQVLKWHEQGIECIPSELFDAPDADRLILGAPEPPGREGVVAARIPPSLPGYLRSLYFTPLLTAEQERDLFRRYNYLKHRALLTLKSVKVDAVTQAQIDGIRGDLDQAEQIKQRIIQANLRLVVSVAKKHLGWSPDFFEIISDGNVSLMRAVEKFDVERGTKFSTYATWAIMKNFARSIPEEHYRARRFVTGQDEMLGAAADDRERIVPESDRQHVRDRLAAAMAKLSERERLIVSNHYGVLGRKEPLTLEQIGRRLGVTKERVRQIELQAMARLRSFLSSSLAEVLQA